MLHFRVSGLIAAGALCLVFSMTASPAFAEVREIEPRPGGTIELHVFAADNPSAAIVMFEGAGGLFKPNGKGFVSARYGDFVDRGFTVVIVGPPADRRGFKGGMPPKYREHKAHLRDIAMAVKMIKTETGLPVWLLGISMGSKSVASFAASRGARMIAGAVFMSSSTNPPGGYRSVADYDFDALKAPVLAVAHRDDACKGTPPDGAEKIVRAAASSVDATVLMLEGGSNRGRSPCGPGSHHTFTGIEDEVVDAIAAFIKQHPR